jgi:hypothetical protein
LFAIAIEKAWSQLLSFKLYLILSDKFDSMGDSNDFELGGLDVFFFGGIYSFLMNFFYFPPSLNLCSNDYYKYPSAI